MSTVVAIAATVRAEFSDLLDPEPVTRVTLRLVVALLLGAAIGWDRERREADAGLRTHMLVALGSALAVIVPAEAGMSQEDLSRVIQGVISGIGFLGAGAVLKDNDQGRIHGLTTAASIWATASVGLAAGLGREATALLATAMVLLVLRVLLGLSRRIGERPGHDSAHPRGDKGDNQNGDPPAP